MEKFAQIMALAKARNDLEKARKDMESFMMLQKMLMAAYETRHLTVDEYVDRMQEIDKKIMNNKEMMYMNLKVIDSMMKEIEKES